MNNILLSIKSVISNYEEFCYIAENLDWINIYEKHEDWTNTYPLGICISIFEFPKKYIENNIKETYVRTILSSIAFNEEWDKDFWDISKLERKKYLTNGKFLYESYATIKDIRLIERTFEHLENEITYFATKNKIPISKQNEYINKLKDAKIIEIGGCYSGDYTYMVIKDNFISIIECGIWD